MHPQFSGPGSRKSFDRLELFRARVTEKEIMSLSCGQLVMIPGVHGVGEQGRGAQRVGGKQVAGGWVARRGVGRRPPAAMTRAFKCHAWTDNSSPPSTAEYC